MSKTILTIESVFNIAKLMKQLMLPLTVVEMAKELGVKRTELMQFINENDKYINTKVVSRCKLDKRGYPIESTVKHNLEVTGIYFDPKDNPLTEEYVEERKKEHWIKLTVIRDYNIVGYQLYIDNCEGWFNQPEDVNLFKSISKVKDKYEFKFGCYADARMIKFDNAFCLADKELVLEEAKTKGLRLYINGHEINTAKDFPTSDY